MKIRTSEQQQTVREQLSKVRAQQRTCMRELSFQCVHCDSHDYLVRALSLASATGAKTSECVRTMDWTNDKMVKFIQAVQTHPVFWETTNKDFKDNKKKKKT